jgi:mono/diheme cytochrome c family protein
MEGFAMTRTTVAILLPFLVGGAARIGAQGGAALDASDIYDGEWQYRTRCATCHGVDGEGIYAFGNALRGNAFVTNVPAPAIIDLIQQGRYNRARAYPSYPGMPAFAYIRGAQALALVEYLKGDLQGGQ